MLYCAQRYGPSALGCAALEKIIRARRVIARRFPYGGDNS